MSDVVDARLPAMGRVAGAALKASSALWFAVAAAGQWTFALYIALQYGAVLWGDWAPLREFMPVGAVDGDHSGNAALIGHLFIAFTITIGGTLQLMPFVRNAAPVFHRWNGRVYIVTAFVGSIAGLYMVWTRDGIGTVVNDIAISIDALLIMAFAVLAVRAAMRRDIASHNRWAVRLFLVVSGVWFMRVLYGFAIMAAQGLPPGVGDNMDGPFDVFVAFGCYLLPLAGAELYFWAKRAGVVTKLATSAVLVGAAGVTAVGVFGAVMIMWLPRVS